MVFLISLVSNRRFIKKKGKTNRNSCEELKAEQSSLLRVGV